MVPGIVQAAPVSNWMVPVPACPLELAPITADSPIGNDGLAHKVPGPLSCIEPVPPFPPTYALPVRLKFGSGGLADSGYAGRPAIADVKQPLGIYDCAGSRSVDPGSANDTGRCKPDNNSSSGGDFCIIGRGERAAVIHIHCSDVGNQVGIVDADRSAAGGRSRDNEVVQIENRMIFQR